jgi:transposase
MEATGVYWKPVYNLLEGEFELWVVNAREVKNLPGRKTDVKDAEWLADLLQHGLLKPSFIPPAPQRDLRELTRYRTTLIEDRARLVNRLQKTLEDANLKLGDVVSDVMGKSARAMLKAIVAGEDDPHRLAALAQGRVRASQDLLVEALSGRVREHHRFMLGEQLRHIEEVDGAIERIEKEIAQRCPPAESAHGPKESSEPAVPMQESQTPLKADPSASPLNWSRAILLLDTIPGINQRSAQGIVAEIGTDMRRFPSAKHLASWAGVCPGNHESAGKQLSGRTRKGNPYLRRFLVQAALAAARQKECYLAVQYRRIASRQGKKKAAIALAHTILTIIYYLLLRGTPYQDLGSNYFDQRDQQLVEKRLVRRLEDLGYQVELHSTVLAG